MTCKHRFKLVVLKQHSGETRGLCSVPVYDEVAHLVCEKCGYDKTAADSSGWWV